MARALGGTSSYSLSLLALVFVSLSAGPAATAQPASSPTPAPQILQLPQTLEFESGGLKYKAQTRNGITVMVAPLPGRILGSAILQVSISNGSLDSQTARSEEFRFDRPATIASSGKVTPPTAIRAMSADAVVKDVFGRASGGDVGRLITVYEAALYNNAKAHSTNGYEARRKYAMAIGNTRMRAASAAAAIILGQHVLNPGDSTDGAVFFPNSGKPLGAGKLTFTIGEDVFVFMLDPILPETSR